MFCNLTKTLQMTTQHLDIGGFRTEVAQQPVGRDMTIVLASHMNSSACVLYFHNNNNNNNNNNKLGAPLLAWTVP